MAGLKLPIATHPLQAFVTEPYKHALDGLVSSMDLFVYVSQTARGELLVGAESSLHQLLDPLDVRVRRRERQAIIQILPYGTRSTAPAMDGAMRHDA